MMKKREKRLIGRSDKADFPQLELNNIDVKIDTGAYSGAIHCEHIEEIEACGKRKIRFRLLDKTHPEYNHMVFEYSNYRQKRVKNSFGVTEKRFVIETLIVLFGEAYLTEFTLSERGEMKFPVLIGRKLLNRSFIVDTAKTNISFKQKTKQQQLNENSNPVPQL
ncbi:MAG: RimK/LysX family protein [Bacteroidales bacterium]|nr:RimK/LysX family protein [Bacteroidales bacterium]MDT8432333.1 RimK/LysX family protein [Bacteroidales bacterium]